MYCHQVVLWVGWLSSLGLDQVWKGQTKSSSNVVLPVSVHRSTLKFRFTKCEQTWAAGVRAVNQMLDWFHQTGLFKCKNEHSSSSSFSPNGSQLTTDLFVRLPKGRGEKKKGSKVHLKSLLKLHKCKYGKPLGTRLVQLFLFFQ